MKRKKDPEWVGIVKDMRCMNCRDNGVDQKTITVVHHSRVGTAYRDDTKVMPLCNQCHLDLHASRKAWREREARWLKELKEDQ